jgi:hypothetical protein
MALEGLARYQLRYHYLIYSSAMNKPLIEGK